MEVTRQTGTHVRNGKERQGCRQDQVKMKSWMGEEETRQDEQRRDKWGERRRTRECRMGQDEKEMRLNDTTPKDKVRMGGIGRQRRPL